MKSKRNSLAGSHPSYDKRGMSKEAIEHKKKYDAKLAAKPSQVKKRVESNQARAEAKKKGKDIQGKDYDHAVGKFVPRSVNRGRKGEGGRV